MNTKINALLASLLLTAALGTAAHAEDKVDLTKGNGIAQHEMKGMPEKPMHEADKAQQEHKPAVHQMAQKKVAAHKTVHKTAHKHKTVKKHHRKHHVVKHKAAAPAKTSAKPITHK